MGTMSLVSRVFSRPASRPRPLDDGRPPHLDARPPHLDADGLVAFRPAAEGGDADDPHGWSTPRRWAITACAVLLVLNATFASTAPSGCLASMAREFGVSREVAGLTMTVFLLGYCAGPLLFAPLSELYGRRWVLCGSFTLYLACNFVCAFAPTFGALLAGRFLAGTLVAAPLSIAPGVVADLWDPVERGTAMAGFSATICIGPALGPVAAGFLEMRKGWRWSFYVLLCLAAATWLLMLAMPETHAPTILRHRAERIRRARRPGLEAVRAPAEASEARSLGAVLGRALTRPWAMLVDPISFLCAVYMCVVYTLLFMLFTIYPIVFQERRGWNPGVGSLPLIGTAVGAALGGLLFLVDTRRRTARIARGEARPGDMEPEDRLPLAMVGGVGFAVTMFWLAWSAEYNSVHWIVPTLAGVFLAASMLLIYVSYLNYLVDTYLEYAASAVAANTVVRSACGAAAPLFTHRMFAALGIGGGGSLIGGIASLLAVIPFLFYRYGRQIRVRSRFAPTGPGKRRAADEEAGPADEEAGPADGGHTESDAGGEAVGDARPSQKEGD